MENLPLGHNHPAFVSIYNLCTTTKFLKAYDQCIINSNLDISERFDLSLGSKPNVTWKGHEGIISNHFVDGKSAIEQAIFASMTIRGNGQRSKALGFEGSSHGSSVLHAQLGWPTLAYPTNEAEEATSLENVRQNLREQREAGTPCSAVVIEPTSQSTGHSVSHDFLASLKDIAHENEAALIVDETSTTYACGERWKSSKVAADYMVYGKRSQQAGFQSTEGDKGFFLTGRKLDLMNYYIMREAVESENLLDRVGRVGTSMQRDVAKAVEKSSRITGSRGSGTCIWIDTVAGEAGNLRAHLAAKGVLVRANGHAGIKVTPALTLEDHQASALSSALSGF